MEKWFARRSPLLAVIGAAAVTIATFCADLLIAGANLSIAYSLAALLAVATRNWRFCVAVAVICTILTWLELLIDPTAAHTPAIAVADRVMVTAVLWLTLAIAVQRERLAILLDQRTQALADANRALQRANRDLQDFASAVAHDLRGPVSAIGLAAEVLRVQTPKTEAPADEDYLGAIQAQIAHIAELIGTLLEYGRAGGTPLRLTQCDCQQTIDRVREILRADLAATRGEIIARSLPTVVADGGLLTRLFQNLIENAIKYRSEAPPQITVGAERHGDFWRFAIEDNGRGVDPEQARTIFEPFRQSSGVESRGGVGLGLATCKRIVERHGGQIEAKPRTGGGTEFCFTIAANLELPSR